MLKLFLASLFPFVCFDVFFGPVFFPVIPATIAIAYFHSLRLSAAEKKKRAGCSLKLVSFSYWAAILIPLFILCNILLAHYLLITAAALAAIAIPAFLKKWRPEITAGILLNISIAALFPMLVPPRITPATLERLENENRVRPIFTFAGRSAAGRGKIDTPYQGVRSIITDSEERAVYFTADVGRGDIGIPSLFRVPLDGKPEIGRFAGDRMFGLAFTPGGGKLLATGYYKHKLHILDPETLRPLGERNAPMFPQLIIVDPRGGRVTVTHESHGTVSVYLLPDLKPFAVKRIAAAPSVIAVDRESRTFFAANWMHTFLLSEIEIYSLRARHRKFPFTPASGGVDFDRESGIVYAINSLDGRIHGVDRASWDTALTFRAPPFARTLRVDAKRRLIYVGNAVEPYIRIYNLDGVLLGRIFAGSNCRDIFLTPVSNRVLAGTTLGLMELKTGDFAEKR